MIGNWTAVRTLQESNMNETLTLIWALSPLLVFVAVCLVAMIVKGEF